MKSITQFVIAFVGGLIPELFLSYIVMRLTGEGWLVFWITYAAIQLFYLIVWIFRSLVTWLFFIVFWKRPLVKGIYEALIERQYPNEGYYLYDTGDVETYFEEIALDPQIRTDTRIHATSVCTHFTVLRETGNLQAIFRLSKVAFEAIKKYFEEEDERINPQHIVDPSTIKTGKDVINALRSQMKPFHSNEPTE